MADRNFLRGGGEMGQCVRAFDWSSSPLGEPETWPGSLRTVVALVLASPFPKCLVWGKEMITIYNDAFVPLLGKKPMSIGRCFPETWSEIWETMRPITERAFAGDATFVEDFPLLVTRNGYPEQTYFTFAYTPVVEGTGEVAGFLSTVMETTGRVEVERRLRILNAELGHRMKNTQAIVQAIARQTLRGLADEAALNAFTQRLIALSSAHDILLKQDWQAAPLKSVIEAVLAHHIEANRFHLDGPDFRIGPQAVLSLSLMMHELATNAIKHGSISVPDGRVDISWSVQGEGEAAILRMRWSERDGPPAVAPVRFGFGSRLIQGGFSGNGQAKLQFLPTGLIGEFEVPVNWITAGAI